MFLKTDKILLKRIETDKTIIMWKRLVKAYCFRNQLYCWFNCEFIIISKLNVFTPIDDSPKNI